MSHALAYVTASKNGVSEPEIEDFISLDDKVGDIEGLRVFFPERPIMSDRLQRWKAKIIPRDQNISNKSE